MATIKSFTDLGQSINLAEILPLESADMRIGNYVGEHACIDGTNVHYYHKSESFEAPEIIPCWSLTALLCVIKEQGNVDLRFLQSTFDNRGNRLANVWCCTFEDIGTVIDLYADNPVDACVAIIEKLNELNLL